MNETLDEKPSNLPAKTVLLVIFVILSGVFLAVMGPRGLGGIWMIAVIVWTAKLVFDLVRWMRSDKATRPKMRFPKKTVFALLIVILAVGYFAYLIARDLGLPDG